jgi:hypothetical protein
MNNSRMYYTLNSVIPYSQGLLSYLKIDSYLDCSIPSNYNQPNYISNTSIRSHLLYLCIFSCHLRSSLHLFVLSSFDLRSHSYHPSLYLRYSIILLIISSMLIILRSIFDVPIILRSIFDAYHPSLLSSLLSSFASLVTLIILRFSRHSYHPSLLLQYFR